MNVRDSGWEARSGVGVGKPGVKKTFRFKISFHSPGYPLCFPVQNPDPQPPTLLCPWRALAGKEGWAGS